VGEGAVQTVRLAAKQRSGLALPLTAARVGTGTVAVRITGPGGFDLERSYTLAAKPATQVLARRTVQQIAKGESLTVSSDLLTDLVPGSGAVALSVGPSTALDVAALLKALDRYPFGCSEQITSRALPLLYVNELAAEAHLALDTAIDQRIRDAEASRVPGAEARGSCVRGARPSAEVDGRAPFAPPVLRSACGRPEGMTPGSTPTSPTS